MKTKKSLLALSLATSLLFPAYGEEINPSEYRQRLGKVVVEEEEFYHNDLDSYARYMPLCSADAQSGKVGIIESAMEYSYTMKVFGQLPLELGVSAKYIGINNSTAVKLPSYLATSAFGVQTTLPFFNFKKTYFTVGLAPTFSADNWDMQSSAFRLSQRYFFIYQPDAKLTLVAGTAICPHETDPIAPIIGFIYKPNDRLTFNIVVPQQPEISYLLNKKLTIFAQTDVIMDEYKVTKDGLKNVVLEYNEMYAGAGFRYEVNKYIQWALSAGGVFNRTIKYREPIGKVKLDDGLYTEFRVEISI